MSKISRVLPLVVVLVAAFGVAAAEFPPVGSPAPAFSLENDEGKMTSLADFRGKWVVLYFYPKNFTGGCTLQARNFQKDVARYEEMGAVIVGVSVDSADSHKSFCEKEGLTFRLLSDTDAAVSSAYNSVMEHEGTKYSSRNTFLIDPRGNLVKVFEKVSPAGHSAEVLATLAELRQ
jgi:thioredoxin-dependent peroxiredoxin